MLLLNLSQPQNHKCDPMRKTAFLFPGQGSQSKGMLSEFADKFVVRECFEEASDILRYDLWGAIQHESSIDITETHRTQPIILTCSVAIWRLWVSNGGQKPDYLAGHSLGEWSALVCSNVVSFNNAVEIVEKRGQLMQAAVPIGEGAMAAILGMDDASIIDICVSADNNDKVSAVNFNAPGQVVIAGETASVQRAITLAKKAGAKRAILLPVSAPFHTSMMRPAAEMLERELENVRFSPPDIPVVHNLNADFEKDPAKIRSLILDQIYNPVQWVSCMRTLKALGVYTYVECGPGRVLSGLARKINSVFELFSSHDIAKFESALDASLEKGLFHE